MDGPGGIASSLLLALAGVALWNSEGQLPQFLCCTVVAGQLAGAAVGVLYRRIPQCSLGGSLVALSFVVYAALV